MPGFFGRRRRVLTAQRRASVNYAEGTRPGAAAGATEPAKTQPAPADSARLADLHAPVFHSTQSPSRARAFLEILMKPSAPVPALTRRDVLRDELLATVDLLKRRRAAEIDEGQIEEYVALHWLEWHGGSLRLTTTGENVCKHQASSLGRAAARPAA